MEAIGQATCQPVSDCGTGTYGKIPLTSSTVFVDQTSTGSGADGSAKKPYPTIGQAIKAAPAGAQIAVAAGKYVESLSLAKKVTLQGRCPQLVVLQGSAQDVAAATIT
jgi:hypothetical protein